VRLHAWCSSPEVSRGSAATSRRSGCGSRPYCSHGVQDRPEQLSRRPRGPMCARQVPGKRWASAQDEHAAIMPGIRRGALAIRVERRLQEQRARVGVDIQTLRERRGWTRIELASRAGLGRMVVSRLERGIANADLEALQRIAAAFDRPLVIDFGGRDPDESPRDAGHLAIQELILRLGREMGATGTFELPSRPAEPWRSVDVGMAFQRERRLVLVECWNTIGDVGAAARASARKQAELADLAVARWGASASVALVWVVRATARNRALVARYPEVFRARFPGSSRRWSEALTTGAMPPEQPGLVWCDVGATRLFAWRR
jgi:transcriptional regulator with XRE-family HTH domain